MKKKSICLEIVEFQEKYEKVYVKYLLYKQRYDMYGCRKDKEKMLQYKCNLLKMCIQFGNYHNISVKQAEKVARRKYKQGELLDIFHIQEL